MNPTIIIAIVAGLVSLVSAILAWRQAERVKKIEVRTQEYLGRLNAQTQVAIEKFRADNERAKKALELAIQESDAVEQAMKRLWKIIQNVKDHISLIRDTSKQNELEKLLSKIRDAGRDIMEVYGESGAMLPRTSQAASHEAKNLILSIYQRLDSLAWRKLRHDFEVRKIDIDSLLQLRDELTRCQGVLVAERAELRINQLHRYTELLTAAYEEQEDAKQLKS